MNQEYFLYKRPAPTGMSLDRIAGFDFLDHTERYSARITALDSRSLARTYGRTPCSRSEGRALRNGRLWNHQKLCGNSGKIVYSDLLQQNLDEEKHADAVLTSISDRANTKADRAA
jgi:hypothetical protein